MGIKLLCLDIDGTILNSRKELTERTRQAVVYAQKMGVHVFLASGRSLPGLRELLQRLCLAQNCICMNGALICADGKEICRNGLEPFHLEKIMYTAEKYKSQVFFSGPDFNLTNQLLEGHLKEEVQKGSLRGDYIIRTDSLEFRREVKKLENKILKAAVKEAGEENYQKMRTDLEAFGLFHIVKSDTHFIDINPIGCTKGTGVRITAEYLGIPMRDVMCIGDNENDEDMVAAAGIGVAMGNAETCVKKAACYVTGTNDEDGAAAAIYHFIPERPMWYKSGREEIVGERD